jgi:hypothetical protein
MSPQEILIREISSRLLEVGIRAYPPSFPFGAHHDHFRTRLKLEGRHAKLSTVATSLTAWAAEREFDEDYVWQAVCGFLLAYFARNPEHRNRLPADIEARMEILRWGEDFRDFAQKANLQA